MRTQVIFKQYIWLLDTIRRHRKLSLAEINELWVDTEMSEGVEIARTTFNRHREAIADIFGIDIECDRSDGNRYYIENGDVLRGNSIQNWMLSTIAMSNVLSESTSLHKRIMIETANTSNDLLRRVIEAMKQMRRVCIHYRRYGHDEAKILTFDPYCIKQFKNRWYILGHFSRKANDEEREEYQTDIIEYFGMFAFDRIEEFTITNERFTMPDDFSAEDYFNDYFGVLVHDGTEMERIVLRAYGYEQYYMQDLPLHHSQRVIAQGEDYTDFELCMKPTIDFNTAILSRGSLIRVLQPQWLADEIQDILAQALLNYDEQAGL